MNLKENILRIVYADTIAAEFIMAMVGTAEAIDKFSITEDRILATAVVIIGVIRVAALLLRQIWLRLIIAYVAVFCWSYFILFVFLKTPAEHLPGGLAALIANVWVAWRLQTEVHIRKDIAIEKEYIGHA